MRPSGRFAGLGLIAFLIAAAGFFLLWRTTPRAASGASSAPTPPPRVQPDAPPALQAPGATQPPPAPPAPPSAAAVPPTARPLPRPPASPPLVPEPSASPTPARPVADVDPDAAADFDRIQRMFRNYRDLFDENPVGTPAEIMKAFMGGNPKSATLGPPQGLVLNDQGELLDRWGTPFFFHQLSAEAMEIRSAGPDRVLWNEDDLTD